MSQDLKPAVLAVQWKESACFLLDQTKIPAEEIYLRCETCQQVTEAIRELVVRGAPAIGVAAAFGVVLAYREALAKTGPPEQKAYFEQEVAKLLQARPTAVNLAWAVARMKRCWRSQGKTESFSDATLSALIREAETIHQQDIQANRHMAELGADRLPEGAIMTVCNTGDLATGGIGTAFGVLHAGFLKGKVKHVYACETRPVLQGIRLTAWELQKNRIPFTVICDNMAASVIRDKQVKAVIAGADRIAENGDVANKIGTYGLAVLAKHHGIPFFVAAPSSTFDLSIKSGKQIPIEERSADEVLSVLGNNRPQDAFPTFNPAFDVTPNELISAIICEKGLVETPSEKTVTALLQ